MARWRKWVGKVQDDRGASFVPRPDQEAKPASLRLLSRAEATERQLGPVQSRSATYRIELLKRDATIQAWPIALVLGGAVFIAACISAATGELDNPAITLPAALLIGLLIALGWYDDRRRVTKIKSALATLPPACLACRYELSGIPRADDGCTVCPECGAAWDFETPV